jgi:hypothetical protein
LRWSSPPPAALAPEKKSEAFSGRGVIFAKAWVNSDFANCDLQAGTDSDRTLAYAGNTLHANVVHRFTKASRAVFRCGSQGAIIRMIKVTANRGRPAHQHAHQLLSR